EATEATEALAATEAPAASVPAGVTAIEPSVATPAATPTVNHGRTARTGPPLRRRRPVPGRGRVATVRHVGSAGIVAATAAAALPGRT
ncbi:MAG TPA: hypothetical protein VGK63_01075, partial [Candidatus Limnocylindrales bacterium]